MTWLSVSIGSQRPLWAKLRSFCAREKVRVEAAALERKVRKPEEELTFKDIHSCLRVLCTLHQGGIKCGNRGTGFLDSEGSHR